jgi:hypothetical protein
MRGKTPDILILLGITDFSTTGSAGLKRRNYGRTKYIGVRGSINNWLKKLPYKKKNEGCY